MTRLNRTLTFAALLAVAAGAHADPVPVPLGQLPRDVIPSAYRLDFTVDPSRQDFTGRTEIDVKLVKPLRTVFLHGSDLRVTAARVRTRSGEVAATYRQVDPSGVAQLDLASELPAGDATITIDYAADFRTGAEGLFHAEVDGTWYAFTQMEPIDARRMFPGFDEPGFKTPFTVTVTTPKDLKVFANAALAQATAAGDSVTHRFAPTEKLPTYLVALGVGPFDVVETVAPANAIRKQPLAMRVIAPRGQSARMQFAAREAPRILDLTEKYLGIPYPYSKLDLLATPNLGGAMENAGLITFDDALLLLDAAPTFRQLRAFAEITAHEIAHQWFGDLVTPTWWTDIWLNESFAEWLGKKIGDQWRPDLGIAALSVQDAFEGMDVDSLGHGRPIRQTITENRQIASAFDDITYLKGGQVLSMFESYLGAEKFAKGVHLHLTRYRFGNASADDFFRSLADAAGNSKVVSAMRTFTDQTGVPIVSVIESPAGIALTQTRFLPLGVAPGPAQTWTIPLCLARGKQQTCSVLEKAAETRPPVAGNGPLMPNASGAGYYRFRLSDAGWDALIKEAPTLPVRDALSLSDSIWADFTAGTGSFDRVIAAARALSTHPDRLAALSLAYRLQELSNTMLTTEQRAQMSRIIRTTYAPPLAKLGFDPAVGAHAKEPAQQQALRQSLVPLVAQYGRDPELRARLVNAALAYLDGNTQALDPAFRVTALTVTVQERGADFIARLRELMRKTTDPQLRTESALAIGGADTAALAQSALDVAVSPGMQSMDSVRILFTLAAQPESRGVLGTAITSDFKRYSETFPGFARPRIVGLFGGYCESDKVAHVEALMRPKLGELGGGDLELAQVEERIGLCVALRQAKGAEVARALAN